LRSLVLHLILDNVNKAVKIAMSYLNRFNGYVKDSEKTYRLPKLEGSIQYMEAARNEIEEKLKNADMGEPNPELVRQTVEKFVAYTERGSTEKFSWLEIALLCRGLLIEIHGFGALIQSEKCMITLLGRFSEQHKNAMLGFYPWQGLLNAYLNYSPNQHQHGKENWQALREYLTNTLRSVANKTKFKPYWFEALSTHRIILKPNATKILAEEALKGHREIIDRIAREVNIPPTSWFWPELLMSQIEAIEKYPDDQFKAAINVLLSQLRERKECIDEGLARILDRYSTCANTEEHQELKAMAISRWKNPSLKKQRDWERVSEKAKEMVQKWIVLEDINNIFKKIVDDHRRYEFWLQFLDQIEFTFIWLGKEAQESFPHIFKRERCAMLMHAGRPDNNVILMKIRDVYIIESGAKAGGKCWAYRAEKILPLLEKSLNYEIFRDPDKNLFTGSGGWSDGLAHQGSVWEQKFHNALKYLGIKPDVMNLETFLSRYQLRLETTPSGTLWVRHFHYEGVIADFLREHGFLFKSFTEGFYLNPRTSSRY
jgi:hypothetical protein